LGLNGIITDIEPLTGFRVKLGSSMGSGAIFFSVEEPIQL
jgi:hypothetical protein